MIVKELQTSGPSPLFTSTTSKQHQQPQMFDDTRENLEAFKEDNYNNLLTRTVINNNNNNNNNNNKIQKLISSETNVNFNNYNKMQLPSEHKQTLHPHGQNPKSHILKRLRPLTNLIWLLVFVFIYENCSSLVEAQCPWSKESIDLHSDCICDFNPSSTSFLDERPVNRISVQCSPVNFKQLISALRQTASVELPNELIRVIIQKQNSTDNVNLLADGGSEMDSEEIARAGLQLASQSKLDLLHVTNSSIGTIVKNTFIIDSTSLSLPPQTGNDLSTFELSLDNSSSSSSSGGQYLVVAIQSLHLSRCGIESIEEGAFNGLEWSLTSLSLSDNYLYEVPREALRSLFNLKVLDLSNNRIMQLDANAFSSLTKLTTLRLADNKQTTNNALNLSNSSMVINPTAFDGLEGSLSDLNLKNTQLSSFPRAVCNLTKLAFLNLAQNRISFIPLKSFEKMNSLTAINLERNRISQMDNNTFEGIENSLSSLSLLGNIFDTFPTEAIAKLSAIRRLDLGFNQIETLPINAFISNRQLLLIALDGNPLETLPEEAFKPLQGTLRGMSIGGRELNCDCRLSWMLRWQQEFNMQISSRERQPQFCARPHYLRSLVSFAALKPEHLVCQPDAPVRSQLSPITIQQPFASATTILTTTIEYQPSNTMSSTMDSSASPSGSSLDVSDALMDRSDSTTERVGDGSSTNPMASEASVSSADDLAAPFGNRISPASPRDYNDDESTTTTFYAGNGIAIGSTQKLPTEEDHFVGDDRDEKQRKQNRQGYLPATSRVRFLESTGQLNQHKHEGRNSGRHQKHGSSSYAPANTRLDFFDELRRLASSTPALIEGVGGGQGNGRKQIHSLTTQLGEPVTSPIDLLKSPTTTMATDQLEERTSSSRYTNVDTQTLSPPRVTSNQKAKQIVQSVFGSRAITTGQNADTTHRNRTNQSTMPNHQVRSSNSVVPAVPTTINVYKSTLEAAGQTASSPIATQTMPVGGPLKGPRLISDDTGTYSPTTFSTQSPRTTILTSLVPSQPQERLAAPPITTTRVPTRQTTRGQLIESDIEKYTIANSNLTPRYQQATVGQAVNRSTTTSSDLSPILRQKLFEIRRVIEQAPQNTIQQASNNTRMSVSSMYRLGAGKSTTTSTTTTTTTSSTTTASPPTTVEQKKPEEAKVTTKLIEPLTSTSPATITSNSSANKNSSTIGPLSPKPTEEMETTTRMAATVRFVDSVGVPIFRLLPSSSSTISTSKVYTFNETVTKAPSTTNIATITKATIPQTTTKGPNLVTESGTFVALSSTSDSTLKLKPPASTIVLSETTTSTKQSSSQTPSKTLVSSEPIQVSKVQLVRKDPETNKSSVLVLREQKQDAKLFVSSNQSSKNPIVAIGVGLASPEETPTTKNEDQSELKMTTSKMSKNAHYPSPNERQSRDSDIVIPLDGSGSSFSSRSILNRLFRLTDFDQIALIMAAFLCLSILMVTFVIVCICSASWFRRTAAAERSTLSDSSESLGKQSFLWRLLSSCFCCCCLTSSNSLSNSARGRRRDGAPKMSPLIADDTSSSSVGEGISNGSSGMLRKSTGRSMLLLSSPSTRMPATNQLHHHSIGTLNRQQASQRDLALFESIRRIPNLAVSGRKQSNKKHQLFHYDNLGMHADFRNKSINPIDHAASIEIHRQAHAIDQEYFMSTMTNNGHLIANTNGRTEGRRKSMLGHMPAPSQSKVFGADELDHWVQDHESNLQQANRRDTISSCDSDKSCSPGANKNNRYNINQAHKHFLTNGIGNRSDQIQASMFVTTLRGCQKKQSQPSLLKTIEAPDYYDRMSSDKSSTDDSRAPLQSTNKLQLASSGRSRMATATSRQNRATIRSGRMEVGSFGIGQMMTRSRSFSKLPGSSQHQAPRRAELVANELQQTNDITGQTANLQLEELMSADLIPVSAEEHWPEPYNEPLELEPIDQQQRQISSTANNSIGNGLRHQHHHQHHHHHHRKHSVDLGGNNRQLMGQQARTPGSAHDDAYLANWHTVSRMGNKQKQQPNYLGESSINDSEMLQVNSSDLSRGPNLIRYRSIPSLAGAATVEPMKQQQQQQQQQTQNNFLVTQVGAANWLRWTPTSQMADRDTFRPVIDLGTQSNVNRGPEMSVTSPISSANESTAFPAGGSWHRDNQVDTLFVSSSSVQPH